MAAESTYPGEYRVRMAARSEHVKVTVMRAAIFRQIGYGSATYLPFIHSLTCTYSLTSLLAYRIREMPDVHCKY